MGAGTRIVRMARANDKRARLYDSYGWVRGLTDLVEMAQLIKQTNGEKLGSEERKELERKRDALCKTLGYEHPFDGPKLADMMAIARAVEGGHDPDPENVPDDWPEDRPWLQKPVAWDPDMRVGDVVIDTLKDGGDLLLSGKAGRLRLAWCIALALDTDRSVLEAALDAAGVKAGISGGTASLKNLIPDGCAPIRVRIGWGVEADNSAHRRMLAHERSGDMHDLVDDMAQSAWAIDLAASDARLLELAEELLQPDASVGADEEPELGGAGRWIFLKEAEEEFGVPVSTLRDWNNKGLFRDGWKKDDDTNRISLRRSDLVAVLESKDRLRS